MAAAKRLRRPVLTEREKQQSWTLPPGRPCDSNTPCGNRGQCLDVHSFCANNPGKNKGQDCHTTSGVCVKPGITQYRPGPPLTDLPACMRGAIQRSIAGKQTYQDDVNMGALGQPNMGAVCTDVLDHPGPVKMAAPFCQQAAYYDTEYCACVNTNVDWAECMFAPCQALTAYKTTTQRETIKNAASACPKENVCQNIDNLGGKENVTKSYQTIDCGDTTKSDGAGSTSSTGSASSAGSAGSANSARTTHNTWKYVLIFIILILIGLGLWLSEDSHIEVRNPTNYWSTGYGGRERR